MNDTTENSAPRGIDAPVEIDTTASASMEPAQIEAMFTRSDGGYAFARWNRPIAPVLFGVEEDTVATFKGAIQAVVALAGHQMAETDPELGANLMFFFLRDWQELRDTPNLDRLIPDLAALTDRLEAQSATQYRAFRFDAEGGIQAAFVFLRVRGAMAEIPAETQALAQSALVMLLWSDRAFADSSPLGRIPVGDGPQADAGTTILNPEIAGLIRAAYDPVMPVCSDDPSHALRLYARMGTRQ